MKNIAKTRTGTGIGIITLFLGMIVILTAGTGTASEAEIVISESAAVPELFSKPDYTITEPAATPPPDVSADRKQALMLPQAPFANLQQTNLHLNEIMASNGSSITDEDGDNEDWIEIYNSGDDPVNLDGYGLSDDYDNPFRWQFPDTTLQPEEFLLIWASNKDRIAPGHPLHTNFAISADGEEVILTHPDSTRLDELPPTEIPTDISIGRQPDGSGEWHFFSDPTPGESNTTTPFTELLSPPEFSRSPGFYASGFTLNITHPDPDVTLYYTLDGSEPDASSQSSNSQSPGNDLPLLEINITDRSPEPNSHSMIETSNISSGSGTWREPAGLIRKSTIIRVKAVKTGHLPATATGTFFVFPEAAQAYSLPVVSITTDSLNLFGHDAGIYVPGINRIDSDQWTETYGNYTERGIEWEREAHIELFDEQSDMELAQNIGIRIHGGNSRRLPQKSLRLYARNEYGESRFRHRIFPGQEDDEYNRLILRQSGSDFGRSMFRDAAGQSLVRHFNMDTQAYRPAALFLNGEYWGIQNFRERYDRHYLERTYHVDPDNVDILTHRYTVKEGSAGHYTEMKDFIKYQDLSLEENFRHVERRMDIDNFLDYYVAQIYFGNYDWPGANIDFWRLNVPYDPDAPAGQDGRWRWMMFDVDVSMGWSSPDYNMMEWLTRDAWWSQLYVNLLENPEFRMRLLNKIAGHLNTAFLPDRVTAVIDSLKARVEPEIEEHIHRWRRPSSLSSWQNQVDRMYRHANERPEHLRRHVMDHFNIESMDTLTVDMDDPLQGRIQVETLPISPEIPGIENNPFPWSGTWFSGVPVTLQAEPGTGYHFSHWEMDGEMAGSQESITVTPGESRYIKAHFSKKTVTDIEPWPLKDAHYHFTRWEADEPETSYPESMAFVYMNEDDPGLNAAVSGLTEGEYQLESRTRINGLGEDGFAFINTGNVDGNPGYPGRRLGGAILALDTRGERNIQVTWRAGTLRPNSRVYNLRLQYRTDTTAPFEDILNEDGEPVEYQRHEEEGHQAWIGPVRLPEDAAEQPRVELLWRYYYTGERLEEESGQRSQLHISDIEVYTFSQAGATTGIPDAFQLYQNYPNPFYPQTTIRYDLPEPQHVRIDLYSITGQHIVNLTNGQESAGHHVIGVDVSSLSSGIYIYRLVSEQYEETGKMTVIK